MGAAAPALIPVVEWVAANWFLVAVTAAGVGYGLYRGTKQPSADYASDYGLRANTRSTQEYLKVIYGKQKIGGNDVYIKTTGADNKTLWIVQTLGEGECDSIEQDGGEDQIWLDDKYASEFGSNATYYFHSGTNTQTVDSNLNTVATEWTDPLINTSYIVWKLIYDANKFNSVPKRTVLLNGLQLFDFRDSSTAWSDNPVLGLYDYMTNARYGMGKSSSIIDTTTWTSAANYCDTKGWTLNIAISQEEAAQDIIDSILSTFRGQLVWWNGKFYLYYSDLTYEASVKTINDEHIFQDDNGKASISISQPSQFNKPDAVRIKFLDLDNDYITDDIVIGEDNGVVKDIKLLGVTDRDQASQLGVYALERQQLNRTITGLFRDDCIELEPHDLITLNCTALSISDQLMRVSSAAIVENGLIRLDLIYESTSLYNDDYDIEPETIYSVDLADPYGTPPSVSNASIAEETYNHRLRSFTRLLITFDPPSDYLWYDHVEVWWSEDDITYKQLFSITDDFTIDPVQEGTTHYIRLKVVNIFGVKQDDIDDIKLSKTVLGYADYPDSLSSLIAAVNQNSVNLYSSKVSDTDIELYEFRLGASWSGSIFLAALRSPNLSLFGVKPGSHTFWANTLSNNGLYGTSPQNVSVELIDPPDGWTIAVTETDDYTSGNHLRKLKIDSLITKSANIISTNMDAILY